ncbi:carbohydrate-binding protein [Streptosporangium sp. V21-05]|uniref:carbohydrate-binding protein n=1 Tax=Streptosporangium sp. V21-05 TaxID=3446115 RepID=UPI003F52A583
MQTADHASAEGGRTVGFVDDGDWISFQPYNLSDAVRFTARVSSAGAGGRIEVRAGSATGTLLGTATVTSTGSWETFADVSANLSGAPSGATTLYLVFRGATGQGYLFDLDAFTFGTGTSPTPTPTPSGDTSALRGVGSNRCLDVSGASQANGAAVNIWDCNGGPNQRWTSTGSGPTRDGPGDDRDVTRPRSRSALPATGSGGASSRSPYRWERACPTSTT